MKKLKVKNKKGFALIAALLAILIITAVGVLVFTITTQDIRVSTRVTGEKKAFSAAEAGIHRTIQNFNPDDLAAGVVTNIQVDPATDPDSRYTVSSLGSSGLPPLPLPGYAIGGGQQWGQARYNASVTGTNTRYASSVTVDVGVGYGPIEITTAYR
ncbi:MAG: PilX N-terminal domain-containing pilus assembly protein [Nitrospirota bacterium]